MSAPSVTNTSRRQFLCLTVASAAALALLEACARAPSAPKPTSGAAAASSSANPLPTYLPVSNGPKPDFHSNDPRITDGFTNFPRSPQKSWTGSPPGAGGTVNVFMAGYYPAPTPRDTNATWRAVEQALNSSVTMTITPNADYATRLATVLAGGDLPEVIHVVGTVVNLVSAQFVQAQMADLTPHLAGDAARDYPNLAAIPSYAYKGAGSIFGNHLYGIPIHRYLPAFWFFCNTDIWDSEIGA